MDGPATPAGRHGPAEGEGTAWAASLVTTEPCSFKAGRALPKAASSVVSQGTAIRSTRRSVVVVTLTTVRALPALGF